MWDGSYDQNTGMKGFRYFREDKQGRQGRQGRAVTIYINVQLECVELLLGMDEELAETLWGRMEIGQGQWHYSTNQEDSSCIPSTTPISVGGTPQQSTGDPGGSRNALMVTSFSK